MNERIASRLLGYIMFWTVVTTLFTWLPLVRIIGRPEGYNWSILGLSGEGLEGPFWIFIPATAFAVLLLYSAGRGPRKLFHALLVIWHLTVTGIVVAGLLQAGFSASWQGQALHLTIPLWLIAIPCVVFTIMTVTWVIAVRNNPAEDPAPWSQKNTFRLVGSLVLLLLGISMFRLGTNYNWVTALAVLITVAHWIILAWSFEPADRSPAASEGTQEQPRA